MRRKYNLINVLSGAYVDSYRHSCLGPAQASSRPTSRFSSYLDLRIAATLPLGLNANFSAGCMNLRGCSVNPVTFWGKKQTWWNDVETTNCVNGSREDMEHPIYVHGTSLLFFFRLHQDNIRSHANKLSMDDPCLSKSFNSMDISKAKSTIKLPPTQLSEDVPPKSAVPTLVHSPASGEDRSIFDSSEC